ncbi:MAG: anti-sigma factor family protein [Candidatus Saccharicenans sp.]
MKCQKYQKLISDWLDGNIKTKERQKLEFHLRSCPSCRQYYEDLTIIDQRIRNLAKPDDSHWPNFEKDLRLRLAQIKEEQAEKKSFWQSLPAPAWALGLAALIIGIYFIISARPEANNEIQIANLLSYEDSYLNLSQAIEEDETVAQKFNAEIYNSILNEIKDGDLQDIKGLDDIDQKQAYEQNYENNLQTEDTNLSEGK